MRTISLDTKNYWEQIGDDPSLTISGVQLLRGAVHAYLTRTIPESVDAGDHRALHELGDTIIFLEHEEEHWTDMLELVVHVPHDPTTHRTFAYLRKTYGESGVAKTPSQL